jgi:hypothetical protein
VEDLLGVEPTDTDSLAEFCVKYHPAVRRQAEEGKSPPEALRSVRRRKSVKAAEDDAERRSLEMAEIIDEHDPLPRPNELRTAQELTRNLLNAFDPWRDDALAESRPMRAAILEVNTYLGDSQPLIELADDGLLILGHQVRAQARRVPEKNAWWLRAVLELVEENALNRTDARIARTRSKKGARKIAEEIHDRQRGVIVRRIVRDASRGKSIPQLAGIYGLPRSTVADIVKRGHGDT